MDASIQSLVNAKDIATTKNLFSPLLYGLIRKYGSTFSQIQQYDGYDLDEAFLAALKGSALIDTDLLGINYLINAKKLIFTTISTTVTNLFNITPFTNLEYLILNRKGSTAGFVTGDLTGLTKLKKLGANFNQCSLVNVTGSMQGLTTLNEICVAIVNNFTTQVDSIKHPIYGNNHELTLVKNSGNWYPLNSTADVGDLANLTKCTWFEIGGTTMATGVGNYILQRLLIAKQGGSPLTRIDISGAVTDNTTKSALTALGVTVFNV